MIIFFYNTQDQILGGRRMTPTQLGIFLIAHAIAHAGLTSAPNPSDPESTPGAFFTQKKRSWLFQRINLDSGLIQKIGRILVIISIAGACVVIGHDFSVFLGFQGDQGMAATVGVFGALFPR
jgi:hypothetical protein